MKKWLLSLILLLILSSCTNEPSEDGSEESTTPPANELSGVVTRQDSGLERIRLPMGFIADPQYAPFYLAVEKGYFAEAGFEIEFDYAFETDGIALVGAGELPFAIVSGEQVILARAQELPIVYVFEWYQDFPIVVVSKESAGIREPQDLTGKRIGLPGLFGASYVGFAGLLEANNLDFEDMQVEEIGFTQVESLLNDRVEAVVGYSANEPLQITASGEAINIIEVADYIDMVANGIITNEKMVEESPEKVQAFVSAFQHGLAETLANPREAYQISKRYVEGLDESRSSTLDGSLRLWEGDRLGLSTLESWEQTQKVLLEIGFLDQPLDNLQSAFTNNFVLEN